jgi:hypothetical protein
MYEDARHLVEDWPEWVAQAQPLGLTPVLRVDTSGPVDHAELAHAVRAHLGLAAAR